MKLFEHIEPYKPVPRNAEDVEDSGSEAQRILKSLEQIMDFKIEKGIKIHPHEWLELEKAKRNVVLENLAEAETSYKQQQACKPEDFQLMTFMLREGYLKEDGETAGQIFIDIDAKRALGMQLLDSLKQSDAWIGESEAKMGMSPEDCATHAEVRRRHWEAVAAPWGMN
jgi:hypothetical protein